MDRKETKYIVVHCSDTKASQDIGAAEIKSWHTSPPPAGRGWSDIGYALVIRRSGAAEAGRDADHDGDTFDDIGAHVAGYNAKAVGVCMVGGKGSDGKPQNNFTKEQFATLARVVRQLKQRFPQAEVVGHRDIPGVAKDCPCFDVRAWWASVK